jgi:hypothetical protein
MSQRPLLFVAMAACLSFSVPVWNQIRMTDGNRLDAEALSSAHHEPGRQELWNTTQGCPWRH